MREIFSFKHSLVSLFVFSDKSLKIEKFLLLFSMECERRKRDIKQNHCRYLIVLRREKRRETKDSTKDSIRGKDTVIICNAIVILRYSRTLRQFNQDQKTGKSISNLKVNTIRG